MFLQKYRQELLVAAILLTTVIITIIYGGFLTEKGIAVRQWSWSNLLYILPLVPLLFLQQKAGLPAAGAISHQSRGWMKTTGVGVLFGLADVLIIKFILHPEPYTELPPFLQPFPYSTFLYSSGALEVELYYRMIPLTLLMLISSVVYQHKFRNYFLIGTCVLTSLVEPILQLPDGAWWFVAYAFSSGVAMNAWQFICYTRYGFVASLAVRLGHYFIWHILLGIYVQYIELS
jgi:hypothetical protein